MLLPAMPHDWTLSPCAAIALQRRLATRVLQTPLVRSPRWIAGLDAAFPDSGGCVAAVVLWDAIEERVVESHTAWHALTFPYIPGLLSFREAPALLAALAQLRRAPDVLVCDGQGRAHPRRFGIASHLGVLLDRPALGCAKTRLTGGSPEPGPNRGDSADLIDRGEVVGVALRTRDHVRPVYVSVGHRIDLEGARRLVLQCARGRRLPEPTRLADQCVTVARRNGPQSSGCTT